jgi:NAD(P)-dependent dehydrogenase (short-subunit alcohol dehydrogenase family)
MYQAPDDLTGTVALVSGASRGIGRIYALALARAGAKVLATARTVEGDPETIGSLAELVATAKAEGLEISACKVDLADAASITAAVDECVSRYGRIDTVVNNAVWTIKVLDFLGIDEDEWETSFRINVLGPYRFMNAAAPHMMANGGGSIVNLTSLAARHMGPGSRSHGFPTYAVTKAALERMTNYAGSELGAKGIVVNAISPGNAEWYMRDGRQPDIDFWGSPVVHLAAQRAPDGINGQIVHTYEFGTRWGPEFTTPPQRDDRLLKMLEIADKPYGYFGQR